MNGYEKFDQEYCQKKLISCKSSTKQFVRNSELIIKIEIIRNYFIFAEDSFIQKSQFPFLIFRPFAFFHQQTFSWFDLKCGKTFLAGRMVDCPVGEVSPILVPLVSMTFGQLNRLFVVDFCTKIFFPELPFGTQREILGHCYVGVTYVQTQRTNFT